MDFVSGLDAIEADTYVHFNSFYRSRIILILPFSSYDEPPPANKWEAFWAWLVSIYILPLNHAE